MVFNSDDEDEIPEWEAEDQRAPLHLEKQWKKEISTPARKVFCQSCGHEVNADALLCLYCGQSTGARAGFLSLIRFWFSKSYLWVLILLVFIVLFLYWRGVR